MSCSDGPPLKSALSRIRREAAMAMGLTAGAATDYSGLQTLVSTFRWVQPSVLWIPSVQGCRC